VFGAVVAVGFTYLFGLRNTWAHRLMVMSLTAVIALVLFAIVAMDHPFSGGASVDPGAFEQILERFETSKLSDL
jgi:type IV secretory pathway VirB2 component (pilin)